MLWRPYPLSQAWSRPIAGAGSPGLESYQPSVQVALATQKLGGVGAVSLYPAAGCEISRGEEEPRRCPSLQEEHARSPASIYPAFQRSRARASMKAGTIYVLLHPPAMAQGLAHLEPLVALC